MSDWSPGVYFDSANRNGSVFFVSTLEKVALKMISLVSGIKKHLFFYLLINNYTSITYTYYNPIVQFLHGTKKTNRKEGYLQRIKLDYDNTKNSVVKHKTLKYNIYIVRYYKEKKTKLLTRRVKGQKYFHTRSFL